MRVIVTGGTGFIGRALVAALAARADEPVVVSRAPGGDPRRDARSVGWDALDREVDGADAVVNLAGEPVADARWTKARLERLRSSRLDATSRAVAAIARATRKPRVLVSASAIGYYGMRKDDAVMVEASPAGDDVLAKLTVDWEAASRPAASSATRVANPRIGVVLGRGGGALAKMLPAFRLFVGGPVGEGTQWVSWVHLRDVVRALLFAVDTDALTGPFNVVAPNPVTMNDLARALGASLGRPTAFRVPGFALRLALGDGLASVLLTGQRATPKALLAAGFTFELPAIEQALAAL
jgi:uncharacterized protein (TIGR01777 family)